MRKLRLCLTLLALIAPFVAVPMARAQLRDCGPGHSGPQKPPQQSDSVHCSGSDVGTEFSTSVPAGGNGTASLTSTSGSSSSTTKKYVPYNRLATGPDGQPCATTGYVEEGRTPSDERLLLDPNPLESKGPSYRDVLQDYPPCPEQPRTAGEAAPTETKAMVAARAWDQRVRLPQPQPNIAPGRAITGKTAYLETRGRLSLTYSENTIFGPLQIIAQGSYAINWGDGETSGPHHVEGGPWPNGTITHEYQQVGSYNIVVTEKWTATWSLDGESGILRTLQTSAGIQNFPVEQIQAVVR